MTAKAGSRRLPSMNKPAFISAVLATAGAVGALAPAAPAAPLSAKFIAYVEGKQTTTWTMARHMTGGDCQGTTYRSGSGTDTVTFKTKPTKVLVFRANPKAGLQVRYGSFDQYSLDAPLSMKGTNTVARKGAYFDELEVGECGPPSDPPEPPKSDCATEKRPAEVSFQWSGDRVSVAANGNPYAIFTRCPLYWADGVEESDFTDGVSQRYPVRDVLDRSQGLVEVLGRKTWTEEQQYSHVKTSTTLKWKLRLRRVR